MIKRQEVKNAIRSYVRKKVSELDDEYCRKSDADITRQVLNLKEYQNSKVMFAFISMGKEPDTLEIIKDAWEKGKVVAAPVCLPGAKMEARQIKSFDDLKKGAYGILEPRDGLPVIDKHDFDFALIPCVSCDKEGNRLGYGMGYFDRYLEGTNFFKCMLCREKILSEIVPLEAHDIQMNTVIYDK